MSANSILLPHFPVISFTEILIVFTISVLAYFVFFNNFEKHLSLRRRVLKLFIVIGILTAIGFLFGRPFFWGIIALMTIGQIVLHAWYFPKKGVNGLTAEPHEKYLEVIREMKRKKK